MTPNFHMDAAPAGDGWILGLIDKSGHVDGGAQPWGIITRCDAGWCDADGYEFEPRAWLALPDPQPRPSGWRKAEGSIVISCGWVQTTGAAGTRGEEAYIVSVEKPDGDYDETRDPYTNPDLQAARAYAAASAAALGLAVIERDLRVPARPRLAFSKVPIVRKRTEAEGRT